MAKRIGQNFGIRYSEAFKIAVVRELEENDLPFEHLRRKYGILGTATVQAWVRKYGNGDRGIRIRVEKPEEINELRRLRARVRARKTLVYARAHARKLQIFCYGLIYGRYNIFY